MINKFIFAIGGALAAAGLICFAALTTGADSETNMAIGGALFSFGSLTVALGFYLQGRDLRARYDTARNPVARDKKADRLCSSCNRESSIVFCRVHVLRLCSNCLDKHDTKSCLYVPAKRAAAAYK